VAQPNIAARLTDLPSDWPVSSPNFIYYSPVAQPNIAAPATDLPSDWPVSSPNFIYYSPLAQPNIAAPATDLPVSSPNFSPSLYITYNGYDYSTLANVYPDGSGVLCQGYDTYLAVPIGWELVPYSSDALAVIQAHTWSTHVIVLSNGFSYWTGSGILYSYYSMYTSGDTYAVQFCYAQILIRRV